MKYIDGTMKKYLADLSAKLPAPGGGSAAAAAGALGTGLLCMVCNFTLGKKDYEVYAGDIESILKKLESVRRRLEELTDRDVQVYGSFSGVYSMPKDTDAEKSARRARMQETLKNAMGVPREIVLACQEAIRVSGKLVDIGNKGLISDVGCGVLLLESAMKAARMNVDINLKSIKDPEFVRKHSSEMDKATGESEGIVRRVVEKTEAAIGADWHER